MWKKFFSKRMYAMFLLALVGMTIYAEINLSGLSDTEPYETISSIALCFAVGIFLTGFLYASRFQRRKVRLTHGLWRYK